MPALETTDPEVTRGAPCAGGMPGIRGRLYSAWWLVKLAAVSLWNPAAVDRAIIGAGRLREQTPSGRRAMAEVSHGR